MKKIPKAKPAVKMSLKTATVNEQIGKPKMPKMTAVRANPEGGMMALKPVKPTPIK